MADKDKAIAGYPAEQVGAAVRKLRTSHGMMITLLAQASGVSKSDISRLEIGKKILPEASVTSICNALGASSPKDLMYQADALPDVSKVPATKAMIKVVKFQGLTLADVERKAELARGSLNNFVHIHGVEGQKDPKASRGVETLFFAAKALGFKSVGEMVQMAQQLPDNLNAEIYHHYQPVPTISGFAISRVGAAMDAMRVSQGKTREILAKESGVSRYSLSALKAGVKSLSDTSVLHVAKSLGTVSVEELVSRAEQLPEINKSSVASAIHTMAKHKGIRLSELAANSNGLTPRTLECFVAARNNSENPYMALETVYPVVKALGFNSLGDLVNEASKLDTRLESDRYQALSFKNAVKTLQQHRQLTGSDMARLCDIKRAAYEHMMSHREGARIPIPVLKKLPVIFSMTLDNIAEIGIKLQNSCDNSFTGSAPYYGHWTSLVEASRLAEQAVPTTPKRR